MPPKRKALAPANGNTGSSPSSAKKAKPNASDSTSEETQELDVALKAKLAQRSGRWSSVSGSKNLDTDYWTSMKDPKYAYEFMCVCNPAQNEEEDDDDDEEDEDSSGADNINEKQPCDNGDKCPCGKTAASIPDHPYVVSRAGLRRHRMAGDMMDLRIPDAFAMYTFNDHASYGALEVVQNIIQDFDDALKANDRSEAWAVIEGLALFMLFGDGHSMAMADDGERISATAALLARMVLAALAMLEDDGQLAEDSEIKNIGYIISLCLKMAATMRDMGLLEDAKPSKAKTFKFNGGNFDLYLLSYAKRAGITPVGVKDVDDKGITMPKTAGTKDPWGWTKALAAYKREDVGSHPASSGQPSPSIGGDSLDITTWPSAERKRCSFDKKDPLPKDLTKKLQEGLVLCRQ
ncbi:hypothetical protein HJFPF1_09063 [Paramyrothecium foliicola]|nr:hypothetical protein HJFPF1_09063 [Paramyrothecium foliicola]